jgi:hypothetical protein
MKQQLLDRRWIRVGFNLGLGIFIAFAACYLILMIGISGIVALFGTAKIAGLGLFTFTISIFALLCILLLLIMIPAFVGKTAAQTINFFRFRKLRTLPDVPEKKS